jgi:serine/threonine-protein kinase
MEHIDGVTLADIATEDLTGEIIASVVRDVGDALAFAHKNGVLHLDIKPANLIINREGLVKVIDFGVSSLSQSTGVSTATAGTIGYMPYEQIAGRAVSEATDQWAYAAVIYELLTDEFPYEEQFAFARTMRRAPDEMTTMIKLQGADEPNLLQSENTTLDSALTQSLSRNPLTRLESVVELQKRLLEGLPPPRTGRKQLAQIVKALTDDSVAGEGDLPGDQSDGQAGRQAHSAAPSPMRGCFSSVLLLVSLLSSIIALCVLLASDLN